MSTMSEVSRWIDALRETQQQDYAYLLGRLKMLERHLNLKYTKEPRYEQNKPEQEAEQQTGIKTG